MIDQEEIRERVELTQKSSEIMVVPCCANVFGDPGSKFALAQLLECW